MTLRVPTREECTRAIGPKTVQISAAVGNVVRARVG